MQSRIGGEAGRVELAMVDGARQIRLLGECDVATAPAVLSLLQQCLRERAPRIVFDLQQVTFLDSSILRIFLAARRELNEIGGEIVLLCRPGFVRRLLSLLELDKLIRICTAEEWREHVAAVN